MDRYSVERVQHLERRLVHTIACNDSALLVDWPSYGNWELHIVARVSISEAYLVRSFYGIDAVRDDIPGLASRLAVALGMAVDIYGGSVSTFYDEWPSCGCELIGCADANGELLPSPEHQVIPARTVQKAVQARRALKDAVQVMQR